MKVKVFLIAILACLSILCLTSCGGKGDVFKESADKGLTCRVTYNFGNGTLEGKNSALYLIAPGALIPEPGVTPTKPETKLPTLSGYRVTGYYVKNEDGTERDWNFATDRVSGDITLYARWKPEYTVRVLYGEEQELSYTLAVTSDDLVMNGFREMDWTGHTFFGFYSDPAFEEPITFPYTVPVSDENPTATVYAKYIEGNFVIIRRAADFGKNIKAGLNYYIDADIDLTGTNVTVAETYSGRFIGNGHTIKGLSVVRRQGKTNTAYGLFGTIASTAEFENITFENVSVQVQLDNDLNTMVNYLGVFAGAVQPGAKFTGVTVTGKLTYDCGGRDLEETLEIGEFVGEVLPDADISGIGGTVTVKSATE